MYERMGFEVAPLSRREIEDISREVRKACRVTDPRFPIVRVVDLVLPRVLPDFELALMDSEEMGGALGLTFPREQTIWLNKDVYEGARRGIGQHRFTIAHELGHLLLGHEAGLARKPVSTKEVPAYRHSEWQADTFAGALLMPSEVVHARPTEGDIVEACGVSWEAARVRLKVILGSKQQ